MKATDSEIFHLNDASASIDNHKFHKDLGTALLLFGHCSLSAFEALAAFFYT